MAVSLPSLTCGHPASSCVCPCGCIHGSPDSPGGQTPPLKIVNLITASAIKVIVTLYHIRQQDTGAWSGGLIHPTTPNLWACSVDLMKSPTMAQWVKNLTAAALVAPKAQVQSLAPHGGLRIQYCQSYSSGSNLGLGTSTCCGCSHQKKKKKDLVS